MLGLGALGLEGCSALISEPTQCAIDDDCRAELTGMSNLRCEDAFCVEATKWYCAGTVDPTTSSGQVRLAYAFAELQAPDTPITTVSARLCRSLDASCSSPVLEDLSAAAGLMFVDVEAGFSGYLEVTGYVGTEASPIMPALVAVPNVANADAYDASDETTIQAVGIFQAANYSAAATMASISVDLEKAHALVFTRACSGFTPAGVEYSATLPAGASQVYFRGGFPTADANDTDESGGVGWANLNSGNFTVEARESDSELVLGTFAFPVREGWFSVATFDPRRIVR